MVYVKTDELYHHGIKGQRWGIRRFQNPDGTLTEAGKKRKERISRYGRGGQINKERSSISYNKFQKSLQKDEEYNRSFNEAMRIAKKYGLDANGEGGNASYWGEKKIRKSCATLLGLYRRLQGKK